LEKIIGLSQSGLSQHLAQLRRQNLVKTRPCPQVIPPARALSPHLNH
jgi:DNA-binding transcriptional ArsR family regulator